MAKVVGIDQSAVKRVTCKGCASIIEYVENEVEHYRGTDYSGGPDGHDYIHCPNCKKTVIIPGSAF